MMEWTDRHCRHFHRLLTRHARLYTVMITSGALRHGDVPKHLDFDHDGEQPVALQLGGSEADELALAARLGAQWGYDEINLNCGCPSERVQKGAFGACLMNEPRTVADGVKAMRDAVDIPVTVKHRIGVDRTESYDFVRDFVGTVADAGCEVFIVHARNAWLQGLSPKENREIPPLRYEVVHRLKRDFPQLTLVINGGLVGLDAIAAQLPHVDGAMIGRDAYHHPWGLAAWDARFFGDARPMPEREDIEAQMVRYMETQQSAGVPWAHVARHMLGLWNGEPGARRWRQVWSDHRLKAETPAHVARLAGEARRAARSTLTTAPTP
ncbi:MAG: tRNA dihydrouridine(20/20a) synthase DusA [Rhodoferax sp.]|nr:tRNA dihydrouridine(20/20a) synthase DusA [Rhodoferax sp.]